MGWGFRVGPLGPLDPLGHEFRVGECASAMRSMLIKTKEIRKCLSNRVRRL